MEGILYVNLKENIVSENDENVPLDRMMRQLKTSSAQKESSIPEGGVRVIREDGSEAIRVRSKKRRSIQPKQEKDKRGNKRKVIFIALVAALLLLSVIAFSVLLGYLNGNRFKSKVSDTIVNASGAEVELGKLDVSSAAARLSTIDLKWSEENTLIKSLKLKTIKADYGMLAFVGGGWGGGAVGIDKADIVIEMGENIPRLNTTPERPVDFKFKLYQCSEVNIDFGNDSLWSFNNGSVSYRVGAKNGGKYNLDSGDFKIPKFGMFKVQTGLVGFGAGSAEVYLDLKSEEQVGSLNIDGEVGYTEGSLVDLKIELKDYPMKDWIDPRARGFINGNIDSGKGTLKMNLGDMDSIDVTVEIISRLIRLNDFEFVKTISQQLQEDYYVRPEFMDESKVTIKTDSGKIEFTDIDLLQDGQMRIKGNFAIDENDQMSGTIKVGLPVLVISRNEENILKKVFKENDGEFIWADVTISGKVTSPEDNLDEIIQDASAKESEINGDQGEELLELKFKELTE